MAYESAQGLSFAFSGKPFTLTSVSFSKKVSEVDVSGLNTKQGEFRSYRSAPLRDGDELSVEFFGLEFPQMTATGAIAWAVDGSGSNAALITSLPTIALCTSSQLQAAAGELIKGSATFRISQS
jgi:hypothetical protein